MSSPSTTVSSPSVSAIDNAPPTVAVRWFRPQSSSAHLDLPTAPVVASTSQSVLWQALTESESEQCEAEWNALTEDERHATEELASGMSDTGDDDVENTDDEEGLVGIMIGEDRLFEVNVRAMTVSRIGPPNQEKETINQSLV